jgi:pimeloyl-ACP methyl ester carboxylesterase
MNIMLAVLAAAVSAIALYLPTRTQAFTHVSVDGGRLRMLATGVGDATVVFENGSGASLEMWGKVQPAVSRFAKTVTYDRFGRGLSPDSPRPRFGSRIAEELRSALRAAGIAPPYILVGHSIGGPLIRIFAGQYPGDVAGLVLVDPTPDNHQVRNTAGMPELQSLPVTLDQSRASLVPPGIPVFLIDAEPPDDVPFATGSMRMLRTSTRRENDADAIEYQKWLDTIPGSRLVTTRSGHNVPVEQPHLVVETIRAAVAQVRR